MSRAWREGKYAQRPHHQYNQWTPAMEQFLRKHANFMSSEELATTLTEQFHVYRTPYAVVKRLVLLGLSTTPLELTALQVATIFNVRTDCVTKWLHRGYLRGVKLSTSLRSPWKIKPGDVEKFIDEHVERYDWRRMPPSRYRALAEITWRSDPTYSLKDAARILGIGMDVLRHALAHGQLQGVATNRARGTMRRWVIRRSALLMWHDHAHSNAAHDAAV